MYVLSRDMLDMSKDILFPRGLLEGLINVIVTNTCVSKWNLAVLRYLTLDLFITVSARVSVSFRFGIFFPWSTVPILPPFSLLLNQMLRYLNLFL